MRIAMLKIAGRFVLSVLFLGIPLSGSANPEMEFPYTMDRTLEKEKTYDYSFDAVWEAALSVFKETGNAKFKKLREEGLNEVNICSESDRGSGWIKITLSHKGEKGILSDKKSLFYYQIVLLEPLGNKKTRVYSNQINFRSYDNYVFQGRQNARYLDLTPPDINILEEISARLREGSVENR